MNRKRKSCHAITPARQQHLAVLAWFNRYGSHASHLGRDQINEVKERARQRLREFAREFSLEMYKHRLYIYRKHVRLVTTPVVDRKQLLQLCEHLDLPSVVYRRLRLQLEAFGWLVDIYARSVTIRADQRSKWTLTAVKKRLAASATASAFKVAA